MCSAQICTRNYGTHETNATLFSVGATHLPVVNVSDGWVNEFGFQAGMSKFGSVDVNALNAG